MIVVNIYRRLRRICKLIGVDFFGNDKYAKGQLFL